MRVLRVLWLAPMSTSVTFLAFHVQVVNQSSGLTAARCPQLGKTKRSEPTLAMRCMPEQKTHRIANADETRERSRQIVGLVQAACVAAMKERKKFALSDTPSSMIFR